MRPISPCIRNPVTSLSSRTHGLSARLRLSALESLEASSTYRRFKSDSRNQQGIAWLSHELFGPAAPYAVVARSRLSNSPSGVAAFSRFHTSASTRSHPLAPSAPEATPRNLRSTSPSLSGFRRCPFGWLVSATTRRPSVVVTSTRVQDSAG